MHLTGLFLSLVRVILASKLISSSMLRTHAAGWPGHVRLAHAKRRFPISMMATGRSLAGSRHARNELLALMLLKILLSCFPVRRYGGTQRHILLAVVRPLRSFPQNNRHSKSKSRKGRSCQCVTPRPSLETQKDSSDSAERSEVPRGAGYAS